MHVVVSNASRNPSGPARSTSRNQDAGSPRASGRRPTDRVSHSTLCRPHRLPLPPYHPTDRCHKLPAARRPLPVNAGADANGRNGARVDSASPSASASCRLRRFARRTRRRGAGTRPPRVARGWRRTIAHARAARVRACPRLWWSLSTTRPACRQREGQREPRLAVGAGGRGAARRQVSRAPPGACSA